MSGIGVDPGRWDEFREAVAEADDPIGEVDQAVAGFALCRPPGYADVGVKSLVVGAAGVVWSA
jgi:hypothetical protein